MRRPATLPVFLQVALLVVLSIVAAQVVAFAVVLHAPPPTPEGFTIDQAVAALEGEPVRTDEGRTLRRRLSDEAAFDARSTEDPLARVIALALESRLGVERGDVRVQVVPVDGPMRRQMHERLALPFKHRMPEDVVRLEERSESFVVRRRVGGPPAPEAPDAPDAPEAPEPPPPPVIPLAPRDEDVVVLRPQQRVTILTEQLRFPPFTATVRQADGRWATVSPPQGLLSPWHMRILLSFLASLLLLSPLAWLIARRLTRPIRVFAEAAERLGSDPHAPPLPETGPAEVRNAAAAFNDMQAKLRRYVEGRTQMVAAIAHDLRTPLTRLRFRAEQTEPEIRDRMAADIEQMDGMIAQALAYVRGETVREDRVALDLGALASSVVHDLAEMGAEVAVEAAPGVRVQAEPLNLRRAVGNLAENAVKFAGAAHVRVTAEEGQAVVVVEDTGQGLPEADLEAVFEPFRRAEPSRSRDTGGAGLGLAVARGIARAHGGDVTLSNRPDGGLAARLTLPLSPETSR